MTKIYVQLLDEGSVAFRPTEGVELGNDKFLILATPNYDRADEVWEFLPGSVVLCRHEIKEGEDILVARELCKS